MLNRRSVLFALLISPAFSPAAWAAAGPDTFISHLADRALNTLADKSLSPATRNAQFRHLFVTNFAVERIGRFVLGRYWRRATLAQRHEYVGLFTDYVVAVYADRLTQYSGLKVRVAGTRPGPDGSVFVVTDVKRPGAPKPAHVIWRVQGSPGSYKIVDVAIEGVSMAITERQEFGSVIENNGGNVGALLAALRHRVGDTQD